MQIMVSLYRDGILRNIANWEGENWCNDFESNLAIYTFKLSLC